MSLLKDDRQKYGVGAIVSRLVSKNFAKRNPSAVVGVRGIDDKFAVSKNIDELKKLSPEDSQKALTYFKQEKLNTKAEFKEKGRLDPSDADYYGEVERKKYLMKLTRNTKKYFLY